MYAMIIQNQNKSINEVSFDNLDALAYGVATVEKDYPCMVIGVIIEGKKVYCSSFSFSLTYLLTYKK